MILDRFEREGRSGRTVDIKSGGPKLKPHQLSGPIEILIQFLIMAPLFDATAHLSEIDFPHSLHQSQEFPLFNPPLVTVSRVEKRKKLVGILGIDFKSGVGKGLRACKK